MKVRSVRSGLIDIVMSVFLCSMAKAQNPVCATTMQDQTAIVESIKTMYAAAVTDDIEKFQSVIAPKFYMYDGGRRYDGDEIMKLIKDQHKKGIRYVWTVTEPEIHISCEEAWIAYVNKGSITTAEGTKSATWLESAVLEHERGVWKIVFFHSTRVPDAVPPTK